MKIIPLLVAVGWCIPGLAFAQAAATGQIENNWSGVPLTGGSATPSGTATSLTAQINESAGGYSLFASGYSYLGVVGATSRAEADGVGNGASGSISATSTGSWTDGIAITWPERFLVSGVDKLRLHFNVSATGGVTASGTSDGPFTLVGGAAAITYSFDFAGQVFQGSRSAAYGQPDSTTGTWGTVAGFVDLPATSSGGGRYTLADVNISLAGTANATVGKPTFGPTSIPQTALGEGNFGSTLVWQGIVGVQAFDANNQEVALPGDFELQLAGAQTGFNYWQAAPVPEPTPAALAIVLIPLALAWQKRRARRQNSGA